MRSGSPRYHEDRVREYLRQGEGAPPPIFVGHQAILNDVLATAREKAGESKTTRILQGAPGAGKSSLLAQMQKKWLGTDEKPRVVALLSTDLMDSTTVGVGAILDAWTMDRKRWKDTLTDRIKRIDGIGMGTNSFSVQFRDAEIPETLRSLGKRYPPTKDSRPIIVAVDEAQRFEPKQTTPEARFLQSIHDSSTSLPLTLVLAGLSDTAEVARAMHLTRGRSIHEVNPLRKFQARYFIAKLALYFGLDTSHHTEQLKALADICDGWPRHLRHAGVSLAEETRRVEGDIDRMDWITMRKRTWSLRQNFYKDQFNTPLRQARRLVAAVMGDIPETKDRDSTRLDRTDVLDLIDLHRDHDNIRSYGWRLPEGISTEGLLNELIHQGVLYEDGEKCIHSPIPSFRSYIIEAREGPKAISTPANEQKNNELDDFNPSSL